MKLTRIPEHWPMGIADNSWRARTSDICVMGLSAQGTDARLGVEDWLFGAGRPCLLFPDTSKQLFSIDDVLICWDLSRSAARTVSDALPILHNAKRVHIVVFRGEKDIPAPNAGELLVAYLETHGIAAKAEEHEVVDHTIGHAILDHANSSGIDLILMGAFGHSRMQEFFLGGATRELLNKSTIPLLMSH